MRRYVDRDKLCDFARNYKDGTIDCNDIMQFPTTEIEEPAPRYIDVNTAIKSFKGSHIEGNCYTPNFIVEFFEKQPTADVEEVKHAKWEMVGNYKVECTNCHHIRDIKTQCGWNFCPTCGAKIDLED